MKRVLDWTLLVILLSITLLWLAVDVSRVENPLLTGSQSRHPRLFPWAGDTATQPWWTSRSIDVTGDSWAAVLEVLIDRNEEHDDQRLFAASVGVAAHAVSHGRRVAEVRIPEDRNAIVGTTPTGRVSEFKPDIASEMTGNRIVRREYDPVLPERVIRRLEADGLLVEFPMAVYAVVDEQPIDRVTVMRDAAAERTFLVPTQLADEVSAP